MFKHTPAITKQLSKAWSLLRRLFSLRIIQVFFIILFILIVSPIILFFILKPKVQHDINYGVTFSSRYAEAIGLNWREAYIKTLDDLGSKNLRLVAYWDEIKNTR